MLGHVLEQGGNATNYQETQPSEVPAPYKGWWQGELWHPHNIIKHCQEQITVSDLDDCWLRLQAEVALWIVART